MKFPEDWSALGHDPHEAWRDWLNECTLARRRYRRLQRALRPLPRYAHLDADKMPTPGNLRAATLWLAKAMRQK